MEYRLLTLWRLVAPREQVFDAVLDSLQWPSWWPGAERVEQIEPGGTDGIGSVRHYVWKGQLPYRLAFDARTTEIEKPQVLAAVVEGDLAGSGRWTFSHDNGVTTVRYEWQVRTTRLWMNALGPMIGAVFANNHHLTMRQGGESLARRLDTTLVEAFYGELS